MPLTELRQYTAHTAQTATPGQLVVMLYDGFLRFCAQGRAAFEAGYTEEIVVRRYFALFERLAG